MIIKPRFFATIAEDVNCHALDFDGSTEFLDSNGVFTLGVADAWTIAGWIKPSSSVSEFSTLFHAKPTANSNNAIRVINRNVDTSPFDLRILMSNSFATQYKELRWNNRTPVDTWTHFVFTYDGAAVGDPVVLYIDGVNAGAPDVTTTDITGSQNDADGRLVEIGDNPIFEPWGGRYHTFAMWSTVLAADAVTAIYNSGSGAFDLTVDSGDYSSSSTLVHWWRFGKNSSNIGEDAGTSPRDLVSGANMDATDIVVDGPGC